MSDLRGDGLLHSLNFSSGPTFPDRPLPQLPPDLDQVMHSSQLAVVIGKLLQTQEFTDVVLKVDGEEFPAHKVILAAWSEYFRAMFYGGMREEKQGVIELRETPLAAFKELMRYVYTGSLSLKEMKEDTVIDLLGLANKCAFPMLQDAISHYLKYSLHTRSVCNVLQVSKLYSLESLTNSCLLFADRNAAHVLESQAFLNLPASLIEELISRDSFCAPEICIFRGIAAWNKLHEGEDLFPIKSLVSRLRLPLISLEELLNVVRPSGLIESDTILDAIKERTEKPSVNLLHRGFLVNNFNVATADTAIVISGECPANLLITPDPTGAQQPLWDGDKTFTRHVIGESEGIIVELKAQYMLNKIVLDLWDREPRMYSYYVEVSMDCKDWVRVADHTKHLCRSKQIILFPVRVVRYIKVVGTYNSVNRIFHLVHMMAMYSPEPFTVDPETKLIVPTTNVATSARNAAVIEGVSRCRNALLNGRTTEYDWDNGYTCHQLGSGSITVQLPQPFLVSSMRLLLWDCDDRYYSYYIEVSVDQVQWKRVVDRSTEECRSWQECHFPPEPVVFIRIVGTYNSANEVFHCVHFECPAVSESEERPSIDASTLGGPLGIALPPPL